MSKFVQRKTKILRCTHMALKQWLFQFLAECLYWLCVESQISRHTVPDLGPSDHRKVSRPKSLQWQWGDRIQQTGNVVGWLLTSQVHSQQPDTKAPFHADTCRSSPPACTRYAYGLEASGVHAGQVWCGQTS